MYRFSYTALTLRHDTILNMTELEHSFRVCKEITKRASVTFYLGSRFFPRELRPSVRAIYAYCRITDDLVDAHILPEDPHARSLALISLVKQLRDVRLLMQFIFDQRTHTLPWQHFSALYPDSSLPYEYKEIYPALAFTVAQFHSLRIQPFLDLVEGMEMDLKMDAYHSYTDLAQYCYKVAGCVGEMICNLCDVSESETICYAYMLGEGMQIINILRDVGEDLARGRVYLAQEDLDTYGVDLHYLADMAHRGAWSREDVQVCNFVNLMDFYAGAARVLYSKSLPHLVELPYRVRKPIQVSAALYLHILDEIVNNDYNVFTRRARVSFPKKVQVLMLSAFDNR
jgi:phytoene synthase